MSNQANSDPSSTSKSLTTEIAEGVHALLGAVNSLIIEAPGGRAVLVDSGQDNDAGKRIRRALEQLALEPVAILNTHSHADHFGGNAYLLKRFPDLEVLAPEFEAAIISTPYLEPVYLFHGASPPKELRSKWLQGPASPVHREIAAGQLEVAGLQLELIDLRGHAHRQLGVRYRETLFAADGVFGEATLLRYPLPFAQDVSGQLASFERLTEYCQAATPGGTGTIARLLPGHGELLTGTERIVELVRLNNETVTRAAEVVLTACSTKTNPAATPHGAGTEEVLAFTAAELGLEMNDLPRYHLNLCTVSAYLTHLRSQGLVEPHTTGGRLYWQATA